MSVLRSHGSCLSFQDMDHVCISEYHVYPSKTRITPVFLNIMTVIPNIMSVLLRHRSCLSFQISGLYFQNTDLPVLAPKKVLSVEQCFKFTDYKMLVFFLSLSYFPLKLFHAFTVLLYPLQLSRTFVLAHILFFFLKPVHDAMATCEDLATSRGQNPTKSLLRQP